LVGELTLCAELKNFGKSAAAEATLIAGGIDTEIHADYRRSLGTGIVFFPNSQIAVIRKRDAYLAVTCGPNGLAGAGGHGHNDKLSFEVSVDGRDIVVDGGCPVYTADPATRNR